MGIYRKGFADMFQRNKWKILRGDKVQIMAGRDAGQVGTVLKVIRDSKFPRVVVEGQNLVSGRCRSVGGQGSIRIGGWSWHGGPAGGRRQAAGGPRCSPFRQPASAPLLARKRLLNNAAAPRLAGTPSYLAPTTPFPPLCPAPLPPFPQNKRHIKRTKDNPGGIVSVESPLHYSNVQLVDPVTDGPVRTTWRYLEDGTKVRVTKGRLSSGSVVPRSDVLKQRRKPRPASAGPADTPTKDAQETTHTPGDLPSFLKKAVQQQQRQHHWAAAAAAPGSSSSSVGAAVARLLGSRLQPLSSGLGGGGSRSFWRGFAASSLWW